MFGRPILDLWVKQLRHPWSNFRHRNEVKYLEAHTLDKYFPKRLSDILSTQKSIYSNFIWTMDGFDRLLDSIRPPAAAWENAILKPPLRDDCDGFHSALYYAVNRNFDCEILTVVTNPVRESHSVLVVKDNRRFYLCNYRYMTPLNRSHFNISSIIEELRQTYYKDKKASIVGWEMSRWDGRGWVRGKFN